MLTNKYPIRRVLNQNLGDLFFRAILNTFDRKVIFENSLGLKLDHNHLFFEKKQSSGQTKRQTNEFHIEKVDLRAHSNQFV